MNVKFSAYVQRAEIASPEVVDRETLKNLGGDNRAGVCNQHLILSPPLMHPPPNPLFPSLLGHFRPHSSISSVVPQHAFETSQLRSMSRHDHKSGDEEHNRPLHSPQNFACLDIAPTILGGIQKRPMKSETHGPKAYLPSTFF